MNLRVVFAGAIVALALAGCGGSAPATPAANSGSVIPTIAPSAPTIAPAATLAPATNPPAATSAPEPTNAPAPTSAPQPTSASSGASAGVPVGNIQDVLAKACTALHAQPNFTIKSSMSGDSNGSMLFEAQGTDAAHLNIQTDKTKEEIVILPGALYFYTDGKWQQQKVGTSAAAKQLLQNQIQATRNSAGLLICFGSDQSKDLITGKLGDVRVNMAMPEVVNGVPTLVYEVNVTVNNPDGQGTGAAKYWLGATDSLPQKMTLDYQTASGKSGHVESDYSYANPNIQPPSIQ